MNISTISVPCEVVGCGWRSPNLPATMYAAMVDQLKLHQTSVHDAQSPLAVQYPPAVKSLSLPCHTSEWERFLAQWSSHPPRLAASSEDQRLAVLLGVCGQEVLARLRAVLGPGLDSLPEEEVLAALRGVSVGWGPAVARLMVHTLARREGEGVAQFSARLQLLAHSSSFLQQCSACQKMVDFSSQVVRDRLFASIGAQVNEGVIDSSTVEEVVKWAEMKEEQEGCEQEVMIDTSRKNSIGVESVLEKVEVTCTEAPILEGAEETEQCVVKHLAERKPQNWSGTMTGENRNFKCQKCSNKRVYRTKLGLDRHQKIFCSERVGIKCSICSKAFKTRSGCYKHYKKCHQNLVQASQELFKKTCDSTKSNDDSKIEESAAHSQDLATHREDPSYYIIHYYQPPDRQLLQEDEVQNAQKHANEKDGTQGN